MCEAGVNIKVIQDALGHADISTTLNIYADVTKELKKMSLQGWICILRKAHSRISIPPNFKPVKPKVKPTRTRSAKA